MKNKRKDKIQLTIWIISPRVVASFISSSEVKKISKTENQQI